MHQQQAGSAMTACNTYGSEVANLGGCNDMGKISSSADAYKAILTISVAFLYGRIIQSMVEIVE